jgi:hypothetical protein
VPSMELSSLSSVIAKSEHTFFLPSPVARSTSVVSDSIAHVSVSNPGYKKACAETCAGTSFSLVMSTRCILLCP